MSNVVDSRLQPRLTGQERDREPARDERISVGYLGELRANWRPLLGAIVGLSSGLSLAPYTTSLLAPLFVEDLGWSKAEFAAVGSLALLTVIIYPFVGRLADTIGARKTALIGVISFPVANIILSQMGGDIRVYIALFIFQAAFCITTTPIVYTRVVVQHIVKARGLALGLVASGPALVGLIGSPLLNNFAEAHGWRAGYVALAIYSAIGGTIALLLLPSETRNVDPATRPMKRKASADYPVIFRTPAFWVLVLATFLLNIPQVMALTQLKFVLMANGISATGVSAMISAFAAGMMLGRFLSGYTLDLFPAHIVATVGLILPAGGLFLLASDYDAYPAIFASVVMLGLSFGAENDVLAYLVARNFSVGIFSSVSGLLLLVNAAATSIGTIILSYLLAKTGGFNLFLVIGGVSVLVGALSFLLLSREPAVAAGSLPGDATDAAPAPN